MSVVDTILAILIGLVLPLAAALAARGSSMGALTTSQRVRLYWLNSANLWLVAAVVIGAWLWRGRTFGELGFAAPSWDRIASIAVLAFAAGITLDTWLELRDRDARARTRARWDRDTPFMPATAREYAHYSVMALSAGVCEEIAYRAFLIRFLQGVFAEQAAADAFAVALPALVFGVAHAYQGAWRAAKIALVGALFGFLFVRTSSLWVPIALHAVVDLAMGLVGMRFLRAARDRT